MNKSSLAKYIIGAVIVIAFVLYVIYANQSSNQTAVTTPAPTSTEPNNTPTSTGAASGTGSSSSNMGGMTMGQYKDGTYTGSVADAFYGKLQVQVTIQNSMITNVKFLQAPSGGNSTDVSNMAEPILIQEALAAQAANVNTVSGATQDSESFNESLASALAQAKS